MGKKNKEFYLNNHNINKTNYYWNIILCFLKFNIILAWKKYIFSYLSLIIQCLFTLNWSNWIHWDTFMQTCIAQLHNSAYPFRFNKKHRLLSLFHHQIMLSYLQVMASLWLCLASATAFHQRAEWLMMNADLIILL